MSASARSGASGRCSSRAGTRLLSPQEGDVEEDEAAKKIRSTFDQVGTWHRTPVFVPTVGSQLRADDDAWPYMSISQLSKVGLDVAAEHLHASRVLIDAGELLPFAHRSLLRTALVGAAQTVWLLAADDGAERTRRHRVLLATVYNRHRQYLGGLLTLNALQGEPHDTNTQLVHDHIIGRKNELDTQRAQQGEKANWNDTEAIKEAARACWAKSPKVDVLVQEALLEWQAGSGASHGLVWSALGQAGTSLVTGPDAQGLAVTSAGGSHRRIANAYMLAYCLTSYGWELLRKRGL
jgi:hypothetical protein